MLKKRERLTHGQFDDFFKTGRRFHSPSLTLIYTPYEEFRGAVVVGKKVFKKATQRNRLRRQVYHQLYQQAAKQGRTGVHIMIVKPVAKDRPVKELGAEMMGLLASIHKAR